MRSRDFGRVAHKNIHMTYRDLSFTTIQMALESTKLMDSCVSANLACYEGEWNIPLSFFKHVSTVFVVYI